MGIDWRGLAASAEGKRESERSHEHQTRFGGAAISRSGFWATSVIQETSIDVRARNFWPWPQGDRVV
jgi:hypothetical protein